MLVKLPIYSLGSPIMLLKGFDRGQGRNHPTIEGPNQCIMRVACPLSIIYARIIFIAFGKELPWQANGHRYFALTEQKVGAPLQRAAH